MTLNRKDIRNQHVSMQHRHFRAIAEALRDSKPTGLEQMAQWQSTVNSFIVILRGSNGRFNTERFLAACNYRVTR